MTHNNCNEPAVILLCCYGLPNKYLCQNHADETGDVITQFNLEYDLIPLTEEQKKHLKCEDKIIIINTIKKEKYHVQDFPY